MDHCYQYELRTQIAGEDSCMDLVVPVVQLPTAEGGYIKSQLMISDATRLQCPLELKLASVFPACSNPRPDVQFLTSLADPGSS